MADKCVIFFSANAAVVDIINKQTSKDNGSPHDNGAPQGFGPKLSKTQHSLSSPSYPWV